jgi:FAD/FMN-containing dehydrogenase
MSGHGQKLNRKEETAISALLTQGTLAEAASLVGIGEATLRRWLQRDDFQAAYRRAKRELISGAVHVLLHATGSATKALIDIMNDASQPATARVSAARTVLTMVLHALHDEDLDSRFAEIEQRLAEVNGHHG